MENAKGGPVTLKRLAENHGLIVRTGSGTYCSIGRRFLCGNNERDSVFPSGGFMRRLVLRENTAITLVILTVLMRDILLCWFLQ